MADAPSLPDSLTQNLAFGESGLIPAIAQDAENGEVLMMAWMNAESLAETLATGRVCYFSRSRGKLWRKGESSGQVQFLKDLRLDCDGDTLLLQVEQKGVACHTGRRSCFYRRLTDKGDLEEILPVERDPKDLYGSSS
jgi:phosphoribosyl-AMP cyclohydrolase